MWKWAIIEQKYFVWIRFRFQFDIAVRNFSLKRHLSKLLDFPNYKYRFLHHLRIQRRIYNLGQQKMGDDSKNYYSSYESRNCGTGYMDPDAEKTPETEDRRIDISAEQIGAKLDCLIKSRAVLVRKWLLAVVIIFKVILLLLLTTSILVGVIKLKSIKSKMQRLENENKVLNNYAEEWNLAIMRNLGDTNKVSSNSQRPANFSCVFFPFRQLMWIHKAAHVSVLKYIFDAQKMYIWCTIIKALKIELQNL